MRAGETEGRVSALAGGATALGASGADEGAVDTGAVCERITRNAMGTPEERAIAEAMITARRVPRALGVGVR